tara:strand:+ start:666 stop:968 length:303 start_codon:yes stop_codon:yes gene_type:complete
MGFKSKATKMNKAKKEARVKPVKRACQGHTWGGIATHQHVNEWGKSGSVGKGGGNQKIGQLNATPKGHEWTKGLTYHMVVNARGGDPLEKGPNLYVPFTK